jgi:tetratricopeptide (TPR) repeat protein
VQSCDAVFGARKWLSAASLAVPAALLLFLTFRAGGFFPAQHALVALVFVVALVLRLTVAEHPLAGASRLLVVAGAATALLAAWMLLSGSWSHAPGRALLEYTRALVYLLPLVVLGTLPRMPYAPAWVVRWLALAFVIVCGAGLTTRVAPDVWSVPPSAVTDRLSYPLTYWNGLGITAAIGIVLLTHLTTSLREPRVIRVLAAALCPVLVATAYCTFSRGGILAAAVGIVLVLLVGRPAGLVTGVLPAAGASAVVLLAALDMDVLGSAGFNSVAGIAEGHELARLIGLAGLGAAAARAALLPLDGLLSRWNERRAPLRLRYYVAGWLAAAAVVAAVLVAVGAPGFMERQYNGFVQGNYTFASEQRLRLLDPGNNGRLFHWRVAYDRFRAEPLRGDGAGTYENAWDRYRPTGFDVLDAHSLYLEVMGELGLVGLALLLIALLTILAGFLRLARGSERGPPAALFTAGLIWALHAGIDWDWELTATGAWLFAAGGICLAAPAGASRLRPPGRVARIVLALGCLVLALTPFQVLRSQAALDDAAAAFEVRDCARTIDSALESLSAARARPEPYQLLGYCDTRLGLHDLAIRNLELATERDPDAWQVWYGLAIVRAAAGQDPRPAARRAQQLNPLDPLPAQALDAFPPDRPRVWRRRALELEIPAH